jgi:hypothetical protein
MPDDVTPPPTDKKPDDSPSKGDAAALGIGCLVVLIFLVAIFFVGMTRE